VFTKYEQFRRNIKMHLQDHPEENPEDDPPDIVADRRFKDDYLCLLGEGARFVRVESVFRAQYLGYVLLIFFWKKCTSLTRGVMNCLKRQLEHWVTMS